MDGDETVDPPYLVPGHLREGQSIGPIPVRSFFVLLVTGLLLGLPLAMTAADAFGDIGYLALLAPLVLAAPFALPWLDPPAEHGLKTAIAWLATVVWRNVTWVRLPPWAELREADGLLAFLGVLNHYRRRPALGPNEQPELAVEVAGGVVWVPLGNRREPRAVFRVAPLNLDTASAHSRRGARAQWGAVVNALPHAIQIVVRAKRVTALPVVERIKAYGTSEARELAAWLRSHVHGEQLVDRERFLVVPADDLEQLGDRCAALEASMRRIGLPLERISEDEALRDALSGFLTARPKQFAPALVDVSAADRLTVDGEHVRAFAIGALPAAIQTDWAAPLLDGDLPLDVSIDIEPLDVGWSKLQLDSRRNALESSSLTPARVVAIEQIAGLRMAFERRQTLPQRLTVNVVVRAADRATLERRSRRLRQRARDLGATLRPLTWEQRDGWLAVLPVRRKPMSRRGLMLETGSVARTYPWSAGTLAVEGGVPFGVAASAAVLFTTAHPKAKNKHCAWYGTSGSGKGYSLRVLLSRERFANGLRIYALDQDEQAEYAGRFCDYLHGSRVPIRCLADAEAFRFEAVANPDVVVWDLHESDEGERGAIFAALKRRLVEYMLARPGRAALVIDEAITVTEDELGERTLGDLIRRGRHFGLEVHVLTQRCSDWFGTRIGRTIQSVAASKWFGAMEARELFEIAPSLGLSAEERERIERAGQGEGLLVTAGRRVWCSLYGHTSPAEYAMANTDPRAGDELAEERRNGHELLAIPARPA